MHYGMPQEIFTNGGKNLWRGVMQKSFNKNKTLYKGRSSYYSRRNSQVKKLNAIISTILEKMLFNKLMKLWDLYLDQVVFACQIRTHSTMKTLLFTLIYCKHSHLFRDWNTAFSVELEFAPYEESLKLFQSVLKKAVIAIHERTMKDICVRWTSEAI